jgi:phosphohistidine phosphatase
MKRLYFLRHAKSSWKDTSLADHDRPLAGRGRRAAKTIARHVREQGIEPELVLCSLARRARETLDRIEPALGTPTIRVEGDLYAASGPALLDRLRDVPHTVESVMLIGHNPGLQDLALDLARPSRRRMSSRRNTPRPRWRRSSSRRPAGGSSTTAPPS